MAINKVIYGEQVLIDLTGDTVTADKLLKGYTAHGKDGEPVVGACEFDADTQDATAAVGEILKGKTVYARGTKLEGTMPNNGAVSGEIATKDGTYTVPMGFHDGSGSVGLAASEKVKLVAGNIKAGVELFGVTGTYGGEEIKAQTKSVTPKTTQQTVQPDSGFDYLSGVTVAAIPYAESANAAGGTTVTIAGAA